MKGGSQRVAVPHTADASANVMPKRKRRSRVTVKIEHPTHGKMEVHSMRGILHGEPCTLMASASVGTHEQPVWIQLAKQGRFLGHSAGPFEMTSKTFDEIVQNFKAHPEQIPIDFEHASESDAASGSIPHTGAPAQGWIVDMRVQDGNLFGLVEWGTLARDYIKNGQYKYFSPAIRFGAKDRVSGRPIGARMTSGALTNSPFLSGLQMVAAKDTESSEDLDELEDEEGDDTEETPRLGGGHRDGEPHGSEDPQGHGRQARGHDGPFHPLLTRSARRPRSRSWRRTRSSSRSAPRTMACSSGRRSARTRTRPTPSTSRSRPTRTSASSRTP